MLLNGGELDGVRIFKRETAKLMSTVQSPEKVEARRGLGWDIDTRGGNKIISKGGATAGFTTFIGYSPKTRVGVVALANTSGVGPGDIGFHLLDARYPLWVPETFPSTKPSEPAVAANVLDGYVGHYKLTPALIANVTREDDQLYVQLTNQPRAAVYPKSDKEFAYKLVDAQLTFEAGTAGRPASAFVLHQGGRDMRAERIDAAMAKQLEDSLAQHFKDQKPFSTSEAEVRREVADLQRKQPDYDRLTPMLAEEARQQIQHTEELIASLGSLQSLNFKGVGPGGFDIYQAQFEHGSLDWRILIDTDGKVAGLLIRPSP